jgi:hypothetical protein
MRMTELGCANLAGPLPAVGPEWFGGRLPACRAGRILNRVYPVRYTMANNVTIAYQVVGEGEVDLIVALGSVTHLDVIWEEPAFGSTTAKFNTVGGCFVYLLGWWRTFTR